MEEDLIKIINRTYRLKEKIYQNNVFINPTQKQEEAFYIILKSIVSEIDEYFKKYKNKSHVIKVIQIINFFNEKEYNTRVSFSTNKMNETLDYFKEYYEINNSKENANFISSADYSVFFNIRVILEKMHRDFLKSTFDKSLDMFFLENKL